MGPSSTSSDISVAELRVPAKAWAHLEAADRALKKGSFDQAAKETDRALQLDSACAPAFSMKAFVDMATKQPLAAIQHAERAITIDPRGADSYVALAMADNSVENFAGGEIAARRRYRFDRTRGKRAWNWLRASMARVVLNPRSTN